MYRRHVQIRTADEFIWPQLWIGPSPEAGHRRVHAYGNNFTNNTGGNGNYNSLYVYADFDDNDLMMTSDLDYAIEYINEQYDLISLYESFREANDKLTTYGWQLSIKELFAEM